MSLFCSDETLREKTSVCELLLLSFFKEIVNTSRRKDKLTFLAFSHTFFPYCGLKFFIKVLINLNENVF